MKQHVIVIGGATASGKSALAISLAQSMKGSILNGDSLQLYKHLPLLTARPSEQDCSLVPHHLYGVLEPHLHSSAAWWRSQAIESIFEILHSNRLPIVVGGTGLYLKTLIEGIAHIPQIDPEVRCQAQSLLDKGIEFLYQDLKCIDPESANILNPNDRQRLMRAWEVKTFTNKSIIEWQKESALSGPGYPSLHFHKFLLTPEKTHVVKRADQRFLSMIDRGAIEEVEIFLKNNLALNSPVLHALGSLEIKAYLEGHLTKTAMIEKTQVRTRQYIKRQYTWFKKYFNDADQIGNFSLEEAMQMIQNILKQKGVEHTSSF